MRTPVDDWYWGAPGNEPAGDRFVIANGQPAFWRRVRAEISADEDCAWMPIHRTNKGAQLEDILDMMLTVVPTVQVNLNRFVLEAAQIPVFATFLRGARHDLCNYVSNSAFRTPITPEPYSGAVLRRLVVTVSATLGCDDDWY